MPSFGIWKAVSFWILNALKQANLWKPGMGLITSARSTVETAAFLHHYRQAVERYYRTSPNAEA